jgi:cytidylate kinase
MSGEIAAGKSTVASKLETQFGYERIRSGKYLTAVAKSRDRTTDRLDLQEIGDLLDQETNGKWIADVAKSQIAASQLNSKWVLDSVRRDFQVTGFRDQFGSQIFHVHLIAPQRLLKSRFHQRAQSDERDLAADYAQVKSSETEKHAKGLGAIADLCVSSETFTPVQIAQLIDVAVGLRSQEAKK